MIVRLLVFLFLNFGALAIGGLFTGEGVPSEWYQELAKAPWTPPGWVFGMAWTTIMICYSLYMAYLWPKVRNRNHLVRLYVLQLILNISWNPVFFHFHWIAAGLVVITLLTVLMCYFLRHYYTDLKNKSWLLLPYTVWLFIATSLNTYILIYN